MMSLDLLKFLINEQEYFVILLDCPDNLIHACDFSKLRLTTSCEDVIIGKSIIDDYAQILKTKLTLALSNQLNLHSSIEKNIGYYWNQDLNEESPNLTLVHGTEGASWVGDMYFLWGTDSSKKNKQFGTWLYNDLEGKIIFEVTPIYPETFIDPEDPADVQAYREWMEKEYKPFFTRIISCEVAMRWLEQADLILQAIRENE